MPDTPYDETRVTDGGLELESSITDTTLAVIAFAGGPQGAAIAVGLKTMLMLKEALGFFGYFGSDTKIQDALRSLQKQIDSIHIELKEINARLDELVENLAAVENRATLQRLLDYLDDTKELNLSLLNTPYDDIALTVDIANEAGILVDKFIRKEYDIWHWTDVEVRKSINPKTGMLENEKYNARQKFKNLPTLPVYHMALLTWLTARERVVELGETGRLDDDTGRITRHLTAVSVRPEFDKYALENTDPLKPITRKIGSPESITEHIKWRIRARPYASHPYTDRNGMCHFTYALENWMSGERKGGSDFDLYVGKGSNIACTVNPHLLGAPSLETEAETEAGVDLLLTLAEVLQRVASKGRMKGSFIGEFDFTEIYLPSTLYVITQEDELHWYQNKESNRPGGSTFWEGPKLVGNGWAGFTSVFSGGGAAIYGVQPDGTLLWYEHSGYFDGSRRWKEPRLVDTGWNDFNTIFSGDEYVVYGIKPDGDLFWHRHDGAPTGGGINTWKEPKKVGNDWGHFKKVFSGGQGIIYAIREDGVLLRYKHLGYLTGLREWTEPEKSILAEKVLRRS